MREARSGLATFVDERMHVTSVRGRAPLPSLGDELGLVVLELGQCADVPAAVHDDFLPFERRVEIGDDSHAPVALLGKHEGLGRGHLLVAGAERTRLELLGSRLIECCSCRSWTLRAAGSDDGDAARLGLAAKLAAQVALSPLPKARSRSTGKTIVVACEEPSSRSVCK